MGWWSFPFSGLEDQDVGRLRTAAGELRRRGEGGVFPFEIVLADPTGLRTATSYVDWDSLLDEFWHELPQRRQSQRRHRLDVPILNEHRGVSGEVDCRLDPGFCRAIHRKVKRDAGFGRIIRTVGCDVDKACHEVLSVGGRAVHGSRSTDSPRA